MAKVFPFQALRYNSEKVKPADVVTQPYDKITPAMQDKYYAASPYNLVRIILGKSQAGDNENESVYSRAAANLQHWREQGVLRRDPEPAIYVYIQSFRAPGDATGPMLERRGFIALGQIEDYDQKIVFRHEQTLSKPKADRFNLLQATQAHCGQIFMLYSDPKLEIETALKPSGPPTVEVTDEYGVIHRLWKVSDPAVLRSVQERMATRPILIADGHHRYETALNYRNQRRAQANGQGPLPSDRVMMTFVNMEAPGLLVLPTHRVVFGLPNFSVAAMKQALAAYFELEDLGAGANLDAALAKLHSAETGRTSLLAVTPEGILLLRSRPGVKAKKLEGLSERQQTLDVVQLHRLILEETLGMSEEDIRNQTHLKYIRDAHEAAEEVRRGNANAAFLMNPVRMEQVRDIAFAGEVLPQKSTDFYPKLLSGLTIYSLQDAAEAAGGR
jgi:uncharacterized protein (DUF1015 family)